MSPQGVALGVDIGGTKIASGLVDRSGTVLHVTKRPTRPDMLLADVVASCRDLLTEARKLGVRPLGIGIGSKGAVDRQARTLVSSLYLGRENIALGESLDAAFGLPVVLENDVHAATIGEMVFGAGRICDDFLFLNAGTGISVGIVSSGRLYRGSSGVAGENGHVSMDGTGRFPCRCRLSGCMETVIVAGRAGAVLPSLDLGSASEPMPGLPYALIAAGIIDLVNLLGPRMVILAGGMLSDAKAFDWVAGAIRRWALPEAIAILGAVVRAHAGETTGLIGAAALPFHHDPVLTKTLPCREAIRW